ncbi:MAG: asparaginase [Bacillota bacterium]
MSDKLVNVIRGNIVESLHTGDLAVVDHTGRLLYSIGDPYRVTYLRSAAKPVQTLPMVESGAPERFGLTDREIAVTCASHSAEEMHVEAVTSILRKAGLTTEALQCGWHPPIHRPSADRLVELGQKPGCIHSNCSGKHSGMLALAVQMGWSLHDYYRLEHPVQQAAFRAVAEMSQYPAEKIEIGIDGCGVPVHGMPVYNMALMFARFTKPELFASERRAALERVSRAMTSHPELVAGTGAYNSELMRIARGDVVAKTGAEGVFCCALVGQGIGIAVKVDDGNRRGYEPVITRVLHQLGGLSEEQLVELEKFHNPVVKNFKGEICGRVEPAYHLTKH